MLKKTIYFAILLMMLVGILPTGVLALPTFSNTGFETTVDIVAGTGGWATNKRPSVWQNPNRVNTPPSVPIVAMMDSGVKHSGYYSLKLGSQNDNVRIMVSQNVTGLDPNKYYRLSGYIKTENYVGAELNSVGPIIQALVNGTTNYYATTKIENSTSDWTYVENIFMPGNSAIRIDCNFITGMGFAWFDDISLEEYTPVSSISVLPSEYRMSAGTTLALSYNIFPSNTNNLPITWSSSNNNIATVSNFGVVTAVANQKGRAIISAIIKENICVPSTGGKKTAPVEIEGFCVISVENVAQEIPISSFSLSQTSAALKLNTDILNLTPIFTPINTTNQKVSWVSSNTDIAVVDSGFVVPMGVGTATITAKVGNLSKSCSITVQPKSAIPEITTRTYTQTHTFDNTVLNSGYPKLLFDYNDIANIRAKVSSQLLDKSYKTMANTAYSYLISTNNVHSRTASGGRILNKVICELALTGYINKDMNYINKAISYLIASSNAYTAIDYKNMNGDIALGDAAHAYAVGYDWLYPFMTQAQKEQIETKLDDLIAELLVLVGNDETGQIPAVTSNHNAVSSGGMGLAALVRENRSDVVELAKSRIIEYYKTSIDNDGLSYEGISYYSYGLLGASIFNAALEKQTGEDLLVNAPNYAKTLDMLTYYLKPNRDEFITIGDCDSIIAPTGGIVYFISKYKNTNALWSYLQITGDNGNRSYGGGADYLGSSIPYVLLFMDTNLVPLPPQNLAVNKFFESGFASYRDSWDIDSSLFTFTSSVVPHRGHNQRDENSFTFNALAEDFLIDPGYTPTETISHNSLLIDGSGQSVPGDKYDIYGEVSERMEYDGLTYIAGDASSTYPSRLDIESVTRKILYKGGETPYIILVDDIKKKNAIPSNITLLFQTDIKNRIEINENADSARIIGNNKGANMQILFPYDGDIILRKDNLNNRIINGGRENYKISDYSQPLEALKTGEETIRIVTVLITNPNNTQLPEIIATGNKYDGEIKIKWNDNYVDCIMLANDYISEHSIISEFEEIDGLIYGHIMFERGILKTPIHGNAFFTGYQNSRLHDVEISPFHYNGTPITIRSAPISSTEKRMFVWNEDNKPLN